MDTVYNVVLVRNGGLEPCLMQPEPLPRAVYWAAYIVTHNLISLGTRLLAQVVPQVGDELAGEPVAVCDARAVNRAETFYDYREGQLLPVTMLEEPR